MGTLRRQRRAAASLWRDFREEPAASSTVIDIDWPKALMVMGHVELIAYTTTHGGKRRKYTHQFAPGSKPLLCAGRKRGQLFLIGELFKVDGHGIVDVTADGRRKDFAPTLEVVQRRSRRRRA